RSLPRTSTPEPQPRGPHGSSALRARGPGLHRTPRLLHAVTRAVTWRAVGFFVLISFGLAYALDAVLLSTLRLAHPLAIVPISLRMFTPLIATVIVCRFITFEKWTGAVGLARESFANGQWKKIVSSVLIGFV